MTEYFVDRHRPIARFLEGYFQRSDFRVFQLAGDASSRRYFRVVVEDQSYVLMVWEPFTDDDNYPFLSVLNHFQKHRISVPKIFAKSAEHGLILLEDLGDLTLERKFWENQNQEFALPYYQQALEELYKINFVPKPSDAHCTAFSTAFTKDIFLWEFNYSMKHFVKGYCGITVSEKVDSELRRLFEKICDRLLMQKQVVCHRDYHSRNIMIHLGLVKIIDFQDARLGPIQYDLVSLLKDSYVPLSTENQERLLQEYYGRLEREQKDFCTKDEFFTNYQVQTIQRCFKVCGSFTSFLNLRNDTRYIKDLKATVEKVEDALAMFPEYEVFYNFLLDHGLFERNYEVP